MYLSDSDAIVLELITSNKEPEKKSLYQYFAAGGIAGMVSRTLTAPLDNLRLQIQVHPVKQNLLEGCNYLIKHRGILGLWTGNGINIIKVGPEMAIRFSVFNKIKQLFIDSEKGTVCLPLHKKFASGAIAGMFGQLAIYPMEAIKTRMMVRKPGEFKNVFDCVYKIYKKEGHRGFFRGYLASMIAILPYTGVDLSIYDTLTNRFIISRLKDNERPATWKLSLCASLSIICGQYSSYPFYLAKTRQQARSTHVTLAATTGGRCQLCNIFTTIVKQEGIRGLYRGIIATLIKVLPSGVINYIAYENAGRLLQPYFEHHQ